MTLPFSINGARAVIPGVYDTFRVQGSLPAPVPAGRSVILLGESEKGIPGQELDLRLNFFTDPQEVLDFYGTGPIADAARMAFTTQPSQGFGGAVQRLYVWKTNQTTRASKTISSPAGYGSIVAAEYGEQGNFIRSQIKQVAQVLPTKTFLYLPSPAARSYNTVVNGVRSAALNTLALNLATTAGTPTAFAALLAGVAGLSVSGGAAKTTIVNPNTVDVSFAATNDTLTITKTAGAGDFGTDGAAGDVLVIPEGSALAGASDENAGSYIVVSWSATVIALRQAKRYASGSEQPVASFDLTAALAVDETDLGLFEPITVTQTASPVTGQAASLEILGASGDTFAAGNIMRDADYANIISTASAATGRVAATSPSFGTLSVKLTNASWSTVPSAGDLIKIPRGSLIAGAGNVNIGQWIVTAATGDTITMTRLYALPAMPVTSVVLSGATDILQRAAGFVSTTAAALKMTSSQERQVWVDAIRTSDGELFPTTRTGGQVPLELSYALSGVTAATVSIDANRTMTITPTGGGSTLEVRLLKYKTLGMLVDFLNTQEGISARIPDNRLRSLPTTVLDMVASMPMLSGHDLPAYNGRLKMDYYSWKKLFDDNFGMLAFSEGALVLKSGLPAAEATAGFLTGAEIGATSDADVQRGLDESLKIDVRMVVPLMSRDARYDVEDGNTDPNSTYSIDSINAAVKNHVASASGTLVKKERFGMLSYHGDFQTTMQKCSEIGFERCQMTFQDVRASDSGGSLQWHLPWMAAVAISAGRAQAVLGTSMLRKSFAFNAVRHLGNMSLYSDSLVQDFEPDDQTPGGELSQAIEAGLLCFRSVTGVGVRLESPDLTTRSRDNDPEAWVWERANVLFTCDEVRQTTRTTLESYIGNRQSDTPLSIVRTAANDTIGTFITGGSLLNGSVQNIKRVGVGYRAEVKITPVEALEFIVLDVLAERAPQG